MFYQILTRLFVPDIEGIKPSYQKLDSKLVEKDGVLSRKSMFKKFDNESLNSFKMSDFSLSNILAVGSYDMLKPTYMVDTNNLNVVTQVENVINSLSNEQSS